MMEAIAETATDLIAAGAMTADRIDWELVRDAHMRRLDWLAANPAVQEAIMLEVWLTARAAA